MAATEDVDRIVDEHRVSIEELIASANKLSELSKELDDVVARFKVGQDKLSFFPAEQTEKLELTEKTI